MILLGLFLSKEKKDFDQVCLGHMNDGQCSLLTTGERERENQKTTKVSKCITLIPKKLKLRIEEDFELQIGGIYKRSCILSSSPFGYPSDQLHSSPFSVFHHRGREVGK
jgi:hypothetical protein